MALAADYGLDEPQIALALASVAAASTLAAAVACWWALWALVAIAGFVAALFGASTLSHLYTSRFGKIRLWRQLLDELRLRGDERVLDAGCGRGAVLVEVGRRLPRGKVVGIEEWGRIEGQETITRTNVVAEGVADRVTLQSSDLRSMPFLDRTFPLVVSSLAVNTIADPAGRAEAIAEMWRVLADDGTLLIVDLRHTAEYVRTLEQLGASAVTHQRLGWRGWFGGPFLSASLVRARRPRG